MKAIYKTVGSENILVATCPDNMQADDGAVATSAFSFTSYPDTSSLRDYIGANSAINLRLFKVNTVNSTIEIRSEADITATPYEAWDYKIKSA